MRYRDPKTPKRCPTTKYFRVVGYPVEFVLDGHFDDSTSLLRTEEVLISLETKSRLART